MYPLTAYVKGDKSAYGRIVGTKRANLDNLKQKHGVDIFVPPRDNMINNINNNNSNSNDIKIMGGDVYDRINACFEISSVWLPPNNHVQ